MAIYLIVSGILRLLDIHIHELDKFLSIAVQLLNFAVLLSYPINFFIYCRMSRAFRDAFTKLLCASFTHTREHGLQSIAPTLLTKQCDAITNNLELQTSHIEIERASPVIINPTTNEIPMISLTPESSNDIKKNSTGSIQKPHVAFSDDINQSTHIESTDL